MHGQQNIKKKKLSYVKICLTIKRDLPRMIMMMLLCLVFMWK